MKTLTKLQQAQQRNWKIRSLRALYGLLSILDTDLCLQARMLVDQQLVRMGAEEESVRQRQRNEFYNCPNEKIPGP